MGTVFAVVVYSHSAISIIMNTSTRPSLRLQLLVLVVTVAATATTSNAAPQVLLPRPGEGYPVEVDGQTYRFANDDFHSRSERSPVIPGPFVIPALLKTAAAGVFLFPASCATVAACPLGGAALMAKLALAYIAG